MITLPLTPHRLLSHTLSSYGPVDNVLPYVERNGGIAQPEDANPAELLLETIGSGIHGKSENTSAIWATKWRESTEAHETKSVISDINKTEIQWDSAGVGQTFNASTLTQTSLLTQRMLLNQWRKPAYIYSKIWVHTIQAILIGFTFFQLGTSPVDLQSRQVPLLAQTTHPLSLNSR